MPRRIALIATSLALVVVLAGCGSDDDSADEKDATTTTEEESSTTKADEPDTEETTAPEETTGSTEDTEPTDTTEAPADTGPVEIPEGADFCAAYAAFDEQFEQVPSDTLEDIQAGAVLLRDAIADLAPLAPEELADEFGLLVQVTDDMAEEAADATTVEDAQAVLNDAFSNPEFSAAGEGVDTYFDGNCPQAEDEQTDGAESPETVTPG
jgi:hypothetical protein